MALAWFVSEALIAWGIAAASCEKEWAEMPRDKKETVLRAWRGHIGSPVDFVRLANLKDAPVEADEKPFIVISFSTAEYLSCLSGQIPWGNQKRRGAACYELGMAMEGQIKTTSLECFQDATWEIITKKK